MTPNRGAQCPPVAWGNSKGASLDAHSQPTLRVYDDS
jgi:hypothetical protein